MIHYEITSVNRHQGEGMEEFDDSRIGKQVYTEGFEVGMPAVLHHRDVEGRVMVTSPIVAFDKISDGVRLETTNTTYILREITMH